MLRTRIEHAAHAMLRKDLSLQPRRQTGAGALSPAAERLFEAFLAAGARFAGIRLFSLCLCVFFAAAPAQGAPLNARQAFLRTPSAILEHLGQGLSDQGKYELLTRGSFAGWSIRHSGQDTLELESLSDPASKVLLCLYRGEAGLAAAVGTDFGPFCLTELWRLPDKMAATPMDMPHEPHITDFFARSRHIPADLSVSTTFCARPEGLEVKPQFWSSIGRSRLKPDNAVFYIWTGKRFSKRIVPLHAKRDF